MILPIYAYGHPILRKETEEIDANYPNLKELFANMYETMYAAKGMGLAAPQIGLNIRLFLIDTDQLEDKEPNEPYIKGAFINPIIIEEAGKKWDYEEGCLSIPFIRGKVSRQPQVRIEYYDEDFNLQEKVFTGLTARVIQHEYDHIEGVLFTDLLKPIKKRLVKKRLDKIKLGQIDADYRMIFAKR